MAGYIGSKASVVSSGAERKKTFAISTTTTSLTGLSYTPTYVHVFHNGVRLVDGSDFTATNGTSITLSNSAVSGDEVVVISYSSFQVADHYNKTESDNRYINTAGDTLTGTLGGTAVNLSGDLAAVNTTLTGYLRGPASFTIDPATHADDTGLVIIAGNLQVDGSTTTINSTTLTVNDLNLTLASGAADSAAANGAGITIEGASASLLYSHSGTKFVLNKPLDVTGVLTSSGNLLVGTTNAGLSSSSSATGINIIPNGATAFVRDGGAVMYLNRLTSDGAIVQLRKAGTTVGVLGTVDGDLNVYSAASGHKGLRFGNGYIAPTTNSTAVENNTVDLGLTTHKFKDAHFAGTVNANTYAHDGDSDTYFNFPSANQLSLVGGGAEIVRAYQIAGAYGVLRVNGSGSATYPNFTFNGDDNTGMYRAGTDVLAFTTGGTERMRITSTGEIVTGGLTSSTGQLHLYKADATGGKLVLQSQVASDATAKISMLSRLLDNSNKTAYIEAYRGNINFGGESGYGHVLIGKNTTAFGTAGISLRSEDVIQATRSAEPALEVNRLSTDGEIAGFYKDSARIGSIGTKTGSVYIGTGDAGIGFNHHGSGNLDAIMPYSITAGAFQNGAVDIGGSVNRFKDAHFSGTVNAGTGSFTGGGNTLSIAKGSGTPALAFLGTATDPEASALIEGIAGGGLKFYTSTGALSSPSWSPKITLAANGTTTFAGDLSLANDLYIGNTTLTPSSNHNNQAGLGFDKSVAQLQIASTSNNAQMELSRNSSSDGNWITFRKQSNILGNLGTYGGTLYIGSVGGGIMFNGTDIEPTTGAATRVDNTIGLGSANYRFKDAFIGDGVYLGGTATANKLNSYEEGNWDPVMGGDGANSGTQTYTGTRYGKYIKVGRLVTLYFDLQVTALGTITGNYATIKGFPFNVQQSHMGGGTINYYSSLTGISEPLNCYVGSNEIGYLMRGGASYVARTALTANTRLMGQVSYYTNE